MIETILQQKSLVTIEIEIWQFYSPIYVYMEHTVSISSTHFILHISLSFIFFHHQNEISEIEGLETLSGLRFLTLSHNRIQAVQNIHDSKLGFLDLSHNSIENLDIGKGCASVRFYTFSYFMQ